MDPRTPTLIKGRAIRVEDHSMAPYLMPDDVVWVEEETERPPAFGQLVLTQNRVTGKYSIHRFLPGGLTKADTAEELNLEEASQLKILGVVTGRTTGADARWIPFNHGWVTQVHRLQAVLSLMNNVKNPKLSKAAGQSLRWVGSALRSFENRFLK